MATQLNYDIVPDKSPLYTTVNQLNQSTTDLQVTVQNSTNQPVTISEILIELIKVDQGVDTVQLLLPGSAGGIQFPHSITGPGQATWKVTSPKDGQFSFKADGDGATFPAKDTLSFTLQNVVIREGGTGTAFVIVREASDAARGETEVGIGITQSTLSVQLSSDSHLIEPNGVATLSWTTTDAKSGSLTLPGNSPSSITLDPHTNLTSGQQQVSPIIDTTYSLTCQGRGPNVTSQVTVSVDSLQMSEVESSAEIVHLGGQALLFWHTNADTCTLDDGTGNLVSVPSSVPNTQYPNGYAVTVEKPTTYSLHGTKQLSNGNYVDDFRTKSVQMYAVSISSFSSSATAFDASQTITLSWQTVDAVSCTLSTKEGGGSVNLAVVNRQVSTCHVGASPDGQTLIVTDGSKKVLGRITLPRPCPAFATFVLSASGPVSQDQHKCLVNLTPVQINQFSKNVGSQGRWVRSMEGFYYITFYWLELSWSVSNVSSVQVTINGSPYSNATSGSWSGTWGIFNPPPDTATITCTGFGGPVNQ